MTIKIFVDLRKDFPLGDYYLAEQLFSAGIPSNTGSKATNTAEGSFEIPGIGGGYIWSSTDIHDVVVAGIKKECPNVVEVFVEDKTERIIGKLAEILPRHTYNKIVVQPLSEPT